MTLQGKRVVLLAEDQYEDPELWYPYYRLIEEGVEVTVVAPKAQTYMSKHDFPVKATLAAEEARAADYDGVVIPGGYAPDRMRRDPALLNLVREIWERGGVVAYICHAGWVPISAGIVRDRHVTSVHAIKDDLINAGANWEDKPVVVDGRMVTSRTPEDLPQFMPAVIKALEGSIARESGAGQPERQAEKQTQPFGNVRGEPRA